MNKLLDKYKKIPIPMKASLFFLFCSFIQSAISTLTTPIFTRLLSTAEYGEYSVFNSWQTIVNVFVSFNIYSAVYTQGLVKFDEEKKKYSSSLQGLLLTLCLIWLMIYIIFRDFWNDYFSLSTIQVLSMFIMIWTSGMFNLWATEQRVEYKYHHLVIVTLLVSFTKPIIGICFVIFSDDKVLGRIIGTVIVELCFYSWIFVYEMHRGKKFFSKKIWKYTLKLNLPLIPHYLSQTILGSADRIMIRDMIGEDEAGIYSLAYSISQIMTLFSSAIIQTLNPWIFRKIKYGLIKDITYVAYVVLIIIAGLNLFMIAFAPEIIIIFASKEYCKAIWVMPPVSMSVYFMFAYSLFAAFEFYYEKTYYISFVTFISAGLNVILNYFLLKKFNYYIAGYTTLFCYFLYAFFHYICMSKIIKKELNSKNPYEIKRLLSITFQFILIGFLFLISYNNIVLRYILIMLFFFIIVVKRKWIIYNIKRLIVIKRDN